MELPVLGPLEVTDGTAPLALGGRKTRALLARLALEANRTVAVDRLLDDCGAMRSRAGTRAIQVAAAVDLSPIDAFVSHDERQSAAARLAGLRTVAPGAGVE